MLGILKDCVGNGERKLVFQKQKSLCFHRTKKVSEYDQEIPQSDNLKPVVTVDNHVLQYNKTPKLLGVHLDEKLNFRKHLK